MELLLVRHGPAAERDPRRWPDDRDRPLTPEGSRATKRAARALARLAEPLDRLVSSPAARARRTAEILREALDEPPELELAEELEPGRTAAELLAKLHPEARSRSRWAIVGHEPTLGELVGLCVVGEAVSPVRLSKGGAALLEFPRAMVPSGARLRWLLTRKQLMALAD
jgi:phosphohistidine phosphatase